MFMSCEDCVDARKNVLDNSKDGMTKPEKPPIEVFNFLDVKIFATPTHPQNQGVGLPTETHLQ